MGSLVTMDHTLDHTRWTRWLLHIVLTEKVIFLWGSIFYMLWITGPNQGVNPFDHEMKVIIVTNDFYSPFGIDPQWRNSCRLCQRHQHRHMFPIITIFIQWMVALTFVRLYSSRQHLQTTPSNAFQYWYICHHKITWRMQINQIPYMYTIHVKALLQSTVRNWIFLSSSVL